MTSYRHEWGTEELFFKGYRGAEEEEVDFSSAIHDPLSSICSKSRKNSQFFFYAPG
jgi:hypothetical protein